MATFNQLSLTAILIINYLLRMETEIQILVCKRYNNVSNIVQQIGVIDERIQQITQCFDLPMKNFVKKCVEMIEKFVKKL